MIRRTFYFLLATIILGGLAGAIYWWAFDAKPKMIAGFIMGAPRPVETVSAESARTVRDALALRAKESPQ